jgi:hypothetical protein
MYFFTLALVMKMNIKLYFVGRHIIVKAKTSEFWLGSHGLKADRDF